MKKSICFSIVILLTAAIAVTLPIVPPFLQKQQIKMQTILSSSSIASVMLRAVSAEACESPSDGPDEDVQGSLAANRFLSLFALFFVIATGISLYLFCSLCLFKIARKFNVPNPWTAFIPIAQAWPIVGAAGKPLWWIVFLFIPIYNILAFLYLFARIIEKMGKNKWLVILFLLPVYNIIFLGLLSFSKTEKSILLERREVK